MEPEVADMPRRDLLGLSLDPLTMTQTVARCVEAVDHDEYMAIGVVNAAKVMRLRHDTELRRAVTGCGMVLADGQAVVWASRLLRASVPERVAGVDLFLELLAQAVRSGYRVYFLGARPDVLERMLVTVRRTVPRPGGCRGPRRLFQVRDEQEIVSQIRDSRAQLLFLGMSSPKKELFMSQWAQAAGVSVAHGVGGSFDILAGVTARAPPGGSATAWNGSTALCRSRAAWAPGT